jgi:hypothetical protein
LTLPIAFGEIIQTHTQHQSLGPVSLADQKTRFISRQMRIVCQAGLTRASYKFKTHLKPVFESATTFAMIRLHDRPQTASPAFHS